MYQRQEIKIHMQVDFQQYLNIEANFLGERKHLEALQERNRNEN